MAKARDVLGKIKEARVVKKQDGTPAERMAFFKTVLGSTFKPRRDGKGYVFLKSGGYIDRKREALLTKLDNLGFEEVTSNPTNNPDGSYMGSTVRFQDPYGNRFDMSSSYGPVASSNHHSMELRFT